MVPILGGSACYYTGSLEVMKQVLQVLGAEEKTKLVKLRDVRSSFALIIISRCGFGLLMSWGGYRKV